MNERFELNRITFIWNREKARGNLVKHGVTFEQAANIFSIHSFESWMPAPTKKLATRLLDWTTI